MKPLDITFMVANTIGIALYLAIASHGWRILDEPITSEPFIWAFALPVLAIFFLADIVWGSLLLRYREAKRWLWWLITCGFWLLAILIDFAHH